MTGICKSIILLRLLEWGSCVCCRVWVVLTSVAPLRMLLFKGGVVPFGPLLGQAANTTADSCPAADAQAGSSAQQGSRPAGPEAARGQDELIVNLWRNRDDAVIWDVRQLAQHLARETGSQAAFDRLWRGMERALGGARCPLALPHVSLLVAMYIEDILPSPMMPYVL